MKRSPLFDTLSPDVDGLRTRAVVDTICLSVASDGYITEEEQEAAIQILTRDLAVTSEEAEDLATRAFSRIQTNGLDATMAAIAEAVPAPGDRLALLKAAAVLQSVDDHLRPHQENDFLYRLAAVLDVEHDEVDAIVDAVAVDITGRR